MKFFLFSLIVLFTVWQTYADGDPSKCCVTASQYEAFTYAEKGATGNAADFNPCSRFCQSAECRRDSSKCSTYACSEPVECQANAGLDLPYCGTTSTGNGAGLCLKLNPKKDGNKYVCGKQPVQAIEATCPA